MGDPFGQLGRLPLDCKLLVLRLLPLPALLTSRMLSRAFAALLRDHPEALGPGLARCGRLVETDPRLADRPLPRALCCVNWPHRMVGHWSCEAYSVASGGVYSFAITLLPIQFGHWAGRAPSGTSLTVWSEEAPSDSEVITTPLLAMVQRPGTGALFLRLRVHQVSPSAFELKGPCWLTEPDVSRGTVAGHFQMRKTRRDLRPGSPARSTAGSSALPLPRRRHKHCWPCFSDH